MKHVLIISSSPRKKGNSDLLCDQFAKGAKEKGNKVRKIRIADKKIAYWTDPDTKKKDEVAEEDDAPKILAQMQKADVIVFASPVYFYSICGQLKVLFDRSFSIFPDLKKKQYYFLITMQDSNREMFEGPIKAMQGFLDCFPGSKLKGMICADSVGAKGAVKKTKFFEEAYKLGKKVK